MSAETVAESLLLGLRGRGVRRIFVNAGTDFAPIVEGFLRLRAAGEELPELVVCPHENLAVSMAHGAYLGDGGVPVVMLHTNVGTANAVCGMLNARHARVPLVVAAGRSPVFEQGVLGARDSGIHWAQEMFDQAGMVREPAKWDYELRGAAQLDAVLDRALQLATAEPAGPVYLTLPREVLGMPAAPAAAAGQARTRSAGPAAEALGMLADRLVAAEFPVLVTSSTGEDPTTVPLLDEISRRFAIGVVEDHARHVNADGGGELHLGHAVGQGLAHADVLCFVDVPVPWLPGAQAPRADAFVAHAGPDPDFGVIPMRGHRSDLSIVSGNRELLTALRDTLAAREAEIDPGRRERIAEVARAARATRRSLAELPSTGPIDKAFLNAALGAVRPPEAVVVSEYWAKPDFLPTSLPGTYFGTPPNGGLGWGLPAALGVQLARPEATVIAAVGDGAYLFANPAACHQVMEHYGLPVLTVVCNNGRWGGVEASAAQVYPTGLAAGALGDNPFAELGPLPALEAYAAASGGWGVRVSDRSELVPVLEKALEVVTVERRHALVNVVCR